MKNINKFIFITLTISSTIFTKRQLPLNVIGELKGVSQIKPNGSVMTFDEDELKTMTLNEQEKSLLPSIEDIIIFQKELNLLKKKKMGEKLSFQENFSILLEKRELNKKLNRLKKAMPDLVKFRDHLNRMLTYINRLQPTVKTTQSLKAFLENLTTIFNMSHEFLEKERFIEGYATNAKMQYEITSIMNKIYDNFTKPLIDMMGQTRQDLKNITRW